MTYEEIVAKAKDALGSADVSSYEGHLAIQINITGEGEGIFYAEINEGKLYIEPYDYKGNDAELTAEGKDIIKIFNGTLDPMKAAESGKLTVTGDINKALSIVPVIENNKKAAKKPAAKKPAAKAAAKKPAVKKAAETVKKTAEKVADKAAEKKKATTEAVKAAEKAVKAAAKTAKAPKAKVEKAEEVKPIIGLAEPKKAAPAKTTAAPKTAAKKPAAKPAKESTKSVKKTAAASKNKKG